MQAILEHLSQAHDPSLDLSTRVRHLSLATTALIPSSDADELLETFLALHVDQEPVFRRFSALFIYQLVSARSVFACRCLPALTKLLSDSDEAVVSLALKAATNLYPRALHWAGVQARDPQYFNASFENINRLETLLSKLLEHLNNPRFFSFALAAVVCVILSQSKSHYHPRSFTQLEAQGVGSLEDLRLDFVVTGVSNLAPQRLQEQADRLLEFLCVALVEKHKTFSTTHTLLLVDALVRIASDRPDYCMAVLLSLSAVAADSEHESRLRTTIVDKLKSTLLASRSCVSFHSEVVKILQNLGEQVEHVDLAVFKSQLAAHVKGKSSPAESLPNSDSTPSTSSTSPALDAEHAVAVLSIRARDAGELAKLAINLLGRLPPADPKSGRIRVSRTEAGPGSSVGVRSDEVVPVADVEKLLGVVVSGEVLVTHPVEEILQESADVDMAGDADLSRRSKRRKKEMVALDIKIGDASLVLWPTERRKKLRSISLALETESFPQALELLRNAVKTRDWGSLTQILLMIRGKFGKERYLAEVLPDLGRSLAVGLDSAETVRRCKEECLVFLPEVTETVVSVLENLGTQDDQMIRRQALAAIAALFLTKTRGREACAHSLLRICTNLDPSIAQDAVKLISLKLYEPNQFADGSESQSLAFYRGRFLEQAALTLATSEDSSLTHQVRCGLLVALIRRSPNLLRAAVHVLGGGSDTGASSELEYTITEISGDESMIPTILEVLQDVSASASVVDIFVKSISHLGVGVSDGRSRLVTTVIGKLRERRSPLALFPVLGLVEAEEVVQTVIGLVEAGATAEVEQAVEEAMKHLSAEKAAQMVAGVVRLGGDANKLPNVMTAMNKLFALKDKFDAYRVLSLVIFTVAEDDSLPPPFLRLCIQTLQAFPAMDVFVATEILGRLARPAVYDDPMHWRGLCLVLSQLLSSENTAARHKTCEVCGNLPAAKMAELISRRKDIKLILREWVVQQPFGTLADLRKILME